MTSASSSPATAAPDLNALATTRGTYEGVSGDKIIIALPGTDYRLHLVPAATASAITTPVGKRIKGTIEARALRIFKAGGGGGGRFIEPLDGEPRIVAGRVAHVDVANRRVLVELAAPVWMTLVEGQAADAFNVGEMVNCYVESGTRFTPA